MPIVPTTLHGWGLRNQEKTIVEQEVGLDRWLSICGL